MKRYLTAVVLSLAILSGYAQSTERNLESAKQLNTLAEIYRELELNFVDTLDTSKLFKETIGYMLYQLDPYTTYFTAKEAEEFRQHSAGKYAGIGAVISFHKEKKRSIISQPYAGMPAAKAGLRRGDVIMAIDGQEMRTAELSEVAHYNDSVSNCLRGEPGTSFRLSVQRAGEPELLHFDIVRATIALPSVVYSLCTADSIGYVHVSGYTEHTARDLRETLQSLQQQGMRSLVLDLRGNGGGLISEAVEMLSLFLPRGKEIVSLRGKTPKGNRVYRTGQNPIFEKLPLVVLVDGQSASAAEITAGTLQDYDRAVIMGQNTYGKGLVQTTIKLPGEALLKYTESKYYIPSGRCVQAYKYDEGEPQILPDSLAKTYYTRGGRPVRDCGGIRPDIVLPEDSLPNLLIYLNNSNLIDDFVAEYRAKHPVIAPAQEFRLSADEYDEFIAFLKAGNFTYDQQSVKALQVLRKMAEFEGYGEASKAEFEALEAKLMHNEDYDYHHWEKEIRQVIEMAIVQDHYFSQGANAYLFQRDQEIRQAFDLLKDEAKYKGVLKSIGKKK